MKQEFIFHLIARIHNQANRFLLDELKGHNLEGVAPSHGDVIGALCLYDSMSMKALSKLINKDKSTVTALVNKLMRLGYVKKKQNSQDKRTTIVSLTEKGEKIKPHILAISQKMHKRAYRNLSREQRHMLMTVLTKIHHNLLNEK
jgi:DNA-binding MarR family transcriptional regulator